MPEVEVTINGRRYRIACDEGQEAHLERLSGEVDGRVRGLVDAVGQVGELRLLVMASLLIADELSEATEARSEAGEGVEALAAALEAAAARIDDLAAGLESA